MAGRITGAKPSAAGPERAEPSDLDLIIFWLRESFRSAYAGWVPIIGKNRVVEPVKGLPYVGGGGEGDPYLAGVRDPRSTPRANGGLSAGAPGPAAAPPVWPRRAASPGQGVHVGVLDTRLYPNEWLDGGYVAAEDDLLKVAAPGSRPRPATAGHATFVAGLILHGAPGAELIIRPVLNEQAFGKAWDVAKAHGELHRVRSRHPEPVLRLFHRRRRAAAGAGQSGKPAQRRDPARSGRGKPWKCRRAASERYSGRRFLGQGPALEHADVACGLQ